MVGTSVDGDVVLGVPEPREALVGAEMLVPGPLSEVPLEDAEPSVPVLVVAVIGSLD